jgi:hypothetical protein
VPANAEGVFVGGNGFRAIGVIKALEDTLGRRSPFGVLCACPAREHQLSISVEFSSLIYRAEAHQRLGAQGLAR